MKKQESGISGDRSAPRNSGSAWNRIAGPAIILVCALAATAPQMFRGVSCGHDFDFHLVSWLDALNSWRHGILYPHWTPSANFGAGEPRFLFYPPLTWMMGAALGLFLPWKIVPLALLVLLLTATGLATRALARRAFGDGIATLAGCTAIFSGYALFTAYERSAFAEMTGGFWVPLMLMGILGDWRNGTNDTPGKAQVSVLRQAIGRSALLLALVVAGAWLSNAPVGVMLSYLLAGVAVLCAVLARSWVPVLRGAVATALGLGMAAFFLIPADWEQRWVAIRQAVDDPGLLIENSWLFARHADPRLELHDIELIRVSGIAVTMVAVALIAVAVSWWRKTLPAQRRWWIPLAAIPLVVLFLQLPVSEPVWNTLPKLRFLQFPWRWLVVLEAPMAIFFASAIWAKGRVWRSIGLVACGAVFLAGTVIAGVSLFQGCDEEDAVKGMLADYREGVGFQGTDEYAPPNADDSMVASGLPFACLVTDPTTELGKGDPDMTPEWSQDQGSCEAAFAADQARLSPEHLRLHADAPHAGFLVLRLRTYPAWRVRINGQNIAAMPAREDGLMAVPVPQGQVDVSIDWTTTRDVVLGRILSMVSLLLVTTLWLLDRRRFRPQLS